MKKLVPISMLILIACLTNGCMSLAIHSTLLPPETVIFPGTTSDLSTIKNNAVSLFHKDEDRTILERTLAPFVLIIDTPLSFIVDILFLPVDIYNWPEHSRKIREIKAQYKQSQVKRSEKLKKSASSVNNDNNK